MAQVDCRLPSQTEPQSPPSFCAVHLMKKFSHIETNVRVDTHVDI